MSTEPVSTINDHRLRIVQARMLHAEGKHDEANALMPSAEDLNEALSALRDERATKAAATLKKKEKRAKALSMDLNDLFKDPPPAAETPDADV
jgi:hypothetical protein